MANYNRMIELSMVPPLAKEVVSQINSSTSAKAQVVALTPITVVATTGTLPTPDDSVTIANAASPTVAELQEFCVELNAKLNALVTALKA